MLYMLQCKYKNAKNEKMSTEDSVMITTLEKDTLYGVGFESDSDLENWKILNPSGVTKRNWFGCKK